MGNELPEDQLTESEQDADIAIRDGEIVGRDGETTDNLTGGSSSSGSGSRGSVEDFDPDNYPGARTVSELGEIRRENYGLTDQEQRRVSRGEDPVGSSDGQTFVQYDPEFDGGSGEVLARGDTREEAAANRLENELREAERRGREPENLQINTENLPFDQNLSDTQRSRASQSRQEAETLQEMQENLPDTERLRVQDDLREELGSEIVQRQELENFLQEQAEQRKEQAQEFEISAIEQERQEQRQQIQEEQQQFQRPSQAIQGAEDPTIRDRFEEGSIGLGLDIMDRAGELGETVRETGSNIRDTVDRTVLEANPFMEHTEQPTAADQQLQKGITPEELIAEFGEGTATIGGELGGLTVATPGATSRSLRSDTPSPVEGAIEGPQVLADAAAESGPAQFLAREAGAETIETTLERLGRNADDILKGGARNIGRASPAGIAGSIIPTSQITAPMSMAAGTAPATPGVGPGSQPTPVTPVRPETETTTEPSINPQTFRPGNVETTTEAESIDQAINQELSRVDSATRPITDTTARPVTDPVSTNISRPTSRATSRVSARPNAISTAITSRQAFRPVPRTATRTSTRPTFRLFDTGDDEDNIEEELDRLFEMPEEEPQAFPDLFGALRGATAEQSPDEQTFTGFEDRVEKELDRI